MKPHNYIFLFFVFFIEGHVLLAQKNAGIFYSTLYAKEGVYNRQNYFGDKAEYHFFKDVNGDGKDDAIAVYASAPGVDPGSVMVALSNGTIFKESKHLLTHAYQLGFVYPLMGDINGDGKTDLVYVDFFHQRLNVAYSNGANFDTSIEYQLKTNREQINESYLSDFNGDGKEDFIFYVPKTENTGKWYVCYSEGTNFSNAVSILDDNNLKSHQRFWGDVNGDQCSDLIIFNNVSKTWSVAISDGNKLQTPNIWLTDFNNEQEAIYKIYDLDKDGKDDLVIWNKLSHKDMLNMKFSEKKGIGKGGDCDWWVAYSNNEKFASPKKYIKNHLLPFYKGNTPPSELGLIGTMDGNISVSMVLSHGKWLGVDYPGKNKVADPILIDTWEVWGHDFVPEGGTYDTGNPKVSEKHMKLIKKAGFTYVTMDITNGGIGWVNKRAKTFMNTVNNSNKKLKNNNKLYLNIALGKTRGIKGKEAFFNKLNLECKNAWEEFYLPFKESWYYLHGKPVLVHMVSTGLDYIDDLETWQGDRTFIDRFTNRWMSGKNNAEKITNQPFYGWKIPSINPYHKEMMPLMPMFKNLSFFVPSLGGDMYRKHWMRVLKYQPESIWLNSWNDVEYSGIEPSQIILDQFVSHPKMEAWTDLHGNRMDDFLYIMTCQYMKIYREGNIYENTYLEEDNAAEKKVLKATKKGFIEVDGYPKMAPVLLVPKGFVKQFKGKVL